MDDLPQICQVGPWTFDRGTGELRCGATTVRLDARVASLLEAFLEKPGVYLSVDALLDRVWAPVVVSPSSVYQAINVLRRALVTDDVRGVSIEMIRRRGYLLVVEVTPSGPEEASQRTDHNAPLVQTSQTAVDDAPTSESRDPDGAPPAGGWRAATPKSRSGRLIFALVALLAVVAAGGFFHQFWVHKVLPVAGTGLQPSSALRPPSLAVLAFDVPASRGSGTGQTDAAVLAQDLVARLARRPTLGAVAYLPRKSDEALDQQIRRVGASLGIRYVLDGRMQETSTTVAVDLRLIEVLRQSTVWSQHLEAPRDELFDLIRRLDIEVASKLLSVSAQSLASSDDTTGHIPHPQAYRDYLAGLNARNDSTMLGWKSAVQYFRRAAAADPLYAAPLSALVLAETDIYDQTGEKTWLEAAERDSAAAIRLAPSEPESYGSRGMLRQWYHFDWEGAGADYQAALRLGARSSRVFGYYGSWLAAKGRLSEARAYLLRAVAIDPLSADQWLDLALYDLATGDYRAAEEALDRAREVNDGSAYLLHMRAELYILRGQYQQALETAARIEFDPLRLRNQVMAEHGLGHTSLARQHLEELIRRFPDRDAYQIAQVYGWMGDVENAYQWLNRCVTVRDPGLGFLPYDPLMNKVRSDSRYPGIVRAAGL